jgi:N-acetylglucosamine-6-phosphate deacetylase
MANSAVRCRRIFDGSAWHEAAALLIEDGRVAGIVRDDQIPERMNWTNAAGTMLAAGFVDLQVNGGGGAMFNDNPSVESIRTICAAHLRYGTTALLPTLITDTPETTRAAIEVAIEANRIGIPGFTGIHLEGPHLSVARKGAHSADLIRPMEDADLEMIVAARAELPALLLTCAPESVTPVQVARLAEAGVRVSLGHTACDYPTAVAYAEAGASLVTHLFNAMSPLTHRAPGLVGAALDCGTLNAGLISDGVHVDPAVIRIALRAKSGPGRIFIVTDAMSTIGTEMESFELNGRRVYRRDGRLTLENGTLAGADIDMASSVRFLHKNVGIPLDEALRMASFHGADALGISNKKGTLALGSDADFVELDDKLTVLRSWIGGDCLYEG